MDSDGLYNFDDVCFAPWVGENYGEGGCFGHKILVVRDHHYCGDEECVNALEGNGRCGVCGDVPPSQMGECKYFTTKTINHFLEKKTNHESESGERWMRSFVVITKILNRNSDIEPDFRKIWNSIAFCNYLQSNISAGPNADDWPSGLNKPELFEKSREPFKRIVSELKPELVLFVNEGFHESEALKNIKDLNLRSTMLGEIQIKPGEYAVNIPVFERLLREM